MPDFGTINLNGGSLTINFGEKKEDKKSPGGVTAVAYLAPLFATHALFFATPTFAVPYVAGAVFAGVKTYYDGQVAAAKKAKEAAEKKVKETPSPVKEIIILKEGTPAKEIIVPVNPVPEPKKEEDKSKTYLDIYLDCDLKGKVIFLAAQIAAVKIGSSFATSTNSGVGCAHVVVAFCAYHLAKGVAKVITK